MSACEYLETRQQLLSSYLQAVAVALLPGALCVLVLGDREGWEVGGLLSSFG